MSKENKTPKEDAQEQKIPGMPLNIHVQYVRDISFENPNALESFKPGQKPPKMDVGFSMDASPYETEELKDAHEVILTITATATRDDQTVFIAEVEYATIVSIGEQVPEERRHPLLLIEVPRLIFPFARQIIADVTSKGGYPPLLIHPVNFQQLYKERFGQNVQDEAEPKEK